MDPQKIDLGALRRQAEVAPEPEVAEIPTTPREESFRLVYTAPDGVRHEAAIVSRIMTGDERHVVGRMCGLMANGIPFDNLPAAVQARYYALSIVAVQARDLPNWVETWVKEDAELLDALFVALEGHENRYFRGQFGEGEEQERKPRVEISQAHST